VPYFLVYVSSATTLFSDRELDEILVTSRENNARLNISGMLLYKGGNLMQVLEGEEAKVRTLYAKITADRRHNGFIILCDGYQAERQFSDWTMAFRNLNSPELLSTPGYSRFLNTPLTDPEFIADPSVSQQLLATFKASM
jgi:hypothetical protein